MLRKKSIKNKKNLKTIIGLSLGILGFCIPLIFTFPGLSFAGHLGLGIFMMAAVFWMLEPIPIFSTSMLVIMLQIFLLSQQGPLYSTAGLPGISAQPQSADTWVLPASAVREGVIYERISEHEAKAIAVEILQNGENVVVVSEKITANTEIVTDASHKLIGYKPVSYTNFLGTLASPIIILFLGGFMLAAAAVKYNLDKNLTSLLLRPFGQKPVFIVLGLMLVTATLSAFMSNTATTAMMMTVAIPVALKVNVSDKFRVMLALSIPIAANIGGMATPIGTPPNAIVINALNQEGLGIEFGTWMLFMVPLAVLLLFIAWFTLRIMYSPTIKQIELELKSRFDKTTPALLLYFIFGITVLLWVTESVHGIPSGMIAFIPVAGLTVTSVLKKEDVRSLPWEVLWLVAGGIALGITLQNTGLAEWLISAISWENLPQLSLLLVFALVALMMSNFLSNTVTATLIIPLAISLGTSGIMGEGFSLIITALVIGSACNVAMLLPISTPPNAIAMSTGYIKTIDMIKVGMVVGIIGIIAMLVFAFVYWPLFL